MEERGFEPRNLLIYNPCLQGYFLEAVVVVPCITYHLYVACQQDPGYHTSTGEAVAAIQA